MTARRCITVLLLLFIAAPVVAEDSVLQKLQMEIQNLARVAGPAVVKVTAERKDQSDLEEIFKRHGISVKALINRSSMVGTGFVIAEGLVLTTDQLADSPGSVQVKFSDGTIREGEVLGRDEFFKVALLKVETGEGVKPLELAAADDVPPGSLGILMGNSFGISGNMSLGIVTGARRSADPSDAYDNYLLLNTPILPGDAGGPFLDPQGRVIGMGVIPYSGALRLIGGTGAGQSFGNSFVPTGMGCLVPSADLRFAVEEIKAHGWVRRAHLGVRVNRGTLEVRKVLENTPAADAGLEAGDVFLALAGRALRSGGDLLHVLRRTKIGRSLSLEFRRRGQELSVSIQLGLAPPVAADLIRMVKPDDEGSPVIFRVVAEFEGLGLCPGDRILSVNGTTIANFATLLTELMSRQDSGPCHVVLQRGEAQVEITFTR